MNQRTRITTIALLALAGMAVSSTAALAQDGRGSRDDRPREQQREGRPEQRPERPMLGGPKVRDERLPGVESGFSSGGEDMRRAAGQPVPPQVFRRAMADLMAEDAPLEIRLSPEQRERISGHVRAFEERMRAANGSVQRGQGARGGDRPRPEGMQRPEGRPASNGPEGRPARGQQGPEGRRPQPDMPTDAGPAREGRGPRAEGGQQPDRAAMAREMAGLQQRVWAELSAAQQAHVGKAIESWRKQADEQRMGQMQERYRRDIGQRFEDMDGQRPERGPSTDQAETGGPEELRRWFSQLPEEVRQRVQQRLEAMPAERREALNARAQGMSPEERRQLVRRLLQSEAPNQPGRGSIPPR